MYVQLDVTAEIEIKNVTDLPKLKLLIEILNMKINKSKLAIELQADRRTLNKYLKGFI